MSALQVSRSLKKHFGGDGKEFGRVRGSVIINNGWLAFLHVGAQLFVFTAQDTRPGFVPVITAIPGNVHGKKRSAIDASVLEVELVGKLVEDDVVAVGWVGRPVMDGVPGQDDCASFPGFAGPVVVAFLHDAGAEITGRLREVGAGINKNRAKT